MRDMDAHAAPRGCWSDGKRGCSIASINGWGFRMTACCRGWAEQPPAHFQELLASGMSTGRLGPELNTRLIEGQVSELIRGSYA